jgi:serine/threonine-protein kinase HipA
MKRRTGTVFLNGVTCGRIEELPETGSYRFCYLPESLEPTGGVSVSLTLPRRTEPYESPTLFPFFCGLLAEGSLREMQCRRYRIDPQDDFGLLLRTCGEDVIGAVTVKEEGP